MLIGEKIEKNNIENKDFSIIEKIHMALKH